MIVVDAIDDDDGLIDGAADAVAVLAVCTDSELRGLVANDTPAALEWARMTLETVWTTARPLHAPGE